MDAESEQLTSRYQAVDILALDDAPHPLAARRHRRRHLDLPARGGCRLRGAWKTRGWANVNRRGDYHAPHNHGWSYLSGTYYVRVAPQPDRRARAAQREPAAISFYDPRGAVNMLACAGETLSQREHRVAPTPGSMLLWNSFLNHSVHPNLAETPAPEHQLQHRAGMDRRAGGLMPPAHLSRSCRARLSAACPASAEDGVSGQEQLTLSPCALRPPPVLLVACGFQLRGANVLPPGKNSIYLVAPEGLREQVSVFLEGSDTRPGDGSQRRRRGAHAWPTRGSTAGCSRWIRTPARSASSSCPTPWT